MLYPIGYTMFVQNIVAVLALLLVVAAEAAAPPPVKLSFPPFSTSTLSCAFDKSLNVSEDIICTPSPSASNRQQIVFSYDDDVVSVRYQYKKPVQLWKKGSPYAASFSTEFTLNIHRDAERSVKRVFGGGIAFAITPSLSPGSAGPESFGLFPIHESTGNPATSSSPQTVAVEIDTSRDVTYKWDPQIPHVGIDINSVNSVKSEFLWNGTSFIDRKIAVFIDYDASQLSLAVRFQNLTSNDKPDKSKAKVFLSYPNLDLSKYVNEASYVGFSSRVPVTTDGVYFLYDWKFSTNWVLKKA